VVNLRRQNAELFNRGGYLPLEAFGRRKDNVIAFARILDGKFAISVAPRMVYGQVASKTLQLAHEFWDDTILRRPTTFRWPSRNVLSTQTWAQKEMPLSQILKDVPVGLFISDLGECD
jgi:(1->4)-alpha-D-glucan 1-alpha-D-glucosylmutase